MVNKLEKYNLKMALYIVAIVGAVILNIINTQNLEFDSVCKVLSFLLYSIIIIKWGTYVNKRIINPKTKEYLLYISGLLILLNVIRFFNLSLAFDNAELKRLIHYCYYIPIILVPMFGAFASFEMLTTYKLKHKKLWLSLVYMLSLFFIFFILLNDNHQFVFKYNDLNNVNEEAISMPGYFLIVAWDVYFDIVTILCIFSNAKTKVEKNIIIKCILLVIIGTGYGIVYRYNVFPIITNSIDFAIFFCFIEIFAWEVFVHTGLVLSNNKYEMFFENANVPIWIVNDKGDTCFKSKKAKEKISALNFEVLKAKGKIENKAIQTNASKIKNGYAIWQDDISEINHMIEELQKLDYKIKLEADNIQNNYSKMIENDEKYKKIIAYNTVQKQAIFYIKIIDNLIDELYIYLDKTISTLDEKEKEKFNSNMFLVLMASTMLKRHSNLYLKSFDEKIMTTNELKRSFNELAEITQIFNIPCKINIRREFSSLANDIIFIYDLFIEYLFRNIKKLISTNILIDYDGFANKAHIKIQMNQIGELMLNDLIIINDDTIKKYEISVQNGLQDGEINNNNLYSSYDKNNEKIITYVITYTIPVIKLDGGEKNE